MKEHSCKEMDICNILFDKENNEWDLLINEEGIHKINYCPFCGKKLI